VTPAVEVDHVVPLHLGGKDDETNLQSICHQHHVEKSQKERGVEPRPIIGIDGYPVDDTGGEGEGGAV